MKLVFLGTPEFAVPTLEALVEAGHSVAAVYTQPDRPKGRGHELAHPPVKTCALRLGLEVRQPLKIRHCLYELAAFEAAPRLWGYGQIILSRSSTAQFRHLQRHASLLPKYRGAARFNGGGQRRNVTSVSIRDRRRSGHRAGVEMAEPQSVRKRHQSTLSRDWRRWSPVDVDVLERVEAGQAVATPQDDGKATLAPILKKEDGLIGWNRTASEIHNRSRGFLPWPGAWTNFRGERLNVWKCRPAAVESPATPGKLFIVGRRLFASCGGGTAIELVEVQQEAQR